MANAIDSAVPINLWDFSQPAAKEKTPATDFSSVLDGLKNPTKTPVKYSPAAASYKQALYAYLNDGDASAKAVLDGMTDDEKAEVTKLIADLMAVLQEEIDGTGESGSSQLLLNSLLESAQVSGSDADQTAAQDAIEKLQKTLSELSADDSTGIQAILSQLLPLLVSLNAAQTETSDTVYPQPVADTISIVDGNATYSMSLSIFLDAMQSFSRTLAGIEDPTPVIEEPVIPGDEVTDPVEDPGEIPVPGDTEIPGDIETPGDGDEIPPADDTTPVDDGGETPLTQTAEISSLLSGTLQNARSYTVTSLTAAKSTESSRMLAESSTAKAFLLSQRVNQKSDELEALSFHSLVQPAQYSPSLESAPALSGTALESQINTALQTPLMTLENGKTTELMLTLNPDDLGQIAVKLEKTDRQIVVTLAAASESTQKLLQDKLPSLIAGLQNVNSEVKDVQVVQANQNASFAGLNLNSFAQGQQSSQQNSSSGNMTSPKADTVDETAKQTAEAEFKGGSRLWQTA